MKKVKSIYSKAIDKKALAKAMSDEKTRKEIENILKKVRL